MTDEKIINSLRQANLLMENNNYFIGVIIPSKGKQILFGSLSYFSKEFNGYIINQTESGIGIIPLSNVTGQPMIDMAYFLPQNNIVNVSIKKGSLLFYKKITITDINNQIISFNVQKKVLTVKKHKENLEKFLLKYNSL